jgi:hypothetical protein
MKQRRYREKIPVASFLFLNEEKMKEEDLL